MAEHIVKEVQGIGREITVTPTPTDKTTLNYIRLLEEMESSGFTNHINLTSSVHGSSVWSIPNTIPQRDSEGALFANKFHSTSSIEFKENVERIQSAISLIMSLKGVTFNWKASGAPDMGLIAEEVDEILPEVVSRDDEGKIIGISYNSLTGLLVEAIKAQQEQINKIINFLQLDI